MGKPSGPQIDLDSLDWLSRVARAGAVRFCLNGLFEKGLLLFKTAVRLPMAFRGDIHNFILAMVSGCKIIGSWQREEVKSSSNKWLETLFLT